MSITTKSGYVRPTMQELIDRITGDLNARITGVDGELTRKALSVLMIFAPIIAAVLAGAVYLLYEYLDYAVDQYFVQTATGDNLDRWGEIWDTQRKAATQAEFTLRATGTVGAEIIDGSVWQTADGLQQFEVIDGPWIVAEHGTTDYVDIQVQALVAGADGNQVAGTILALASPITDVDSEATVVSGTEVTGVDAELDEPLRERILYRIAFPPSGGAPVDYVRWAEEVTAVDHAWCLRTYPEPGYCTVLFDVRAEYDADAPLPDGGGAYVVPMVSATGTPLRITVNKVLFAAALGRTPAGNWFAGGVVVSDINNPLGATQTEIDSTGLVSSGDNWYFDLAATPAVAIVATEAIHVLCQYTADVYNSIHHVDTDGVEDRKPSEATVYVRLPTAKDCALTISIPQGTTATDPVNAAITAELLTMIAAERGPSVTITNWQIRQAIGQATGHTTHLLIDVNGEGGDADITTTYNQIQVMESAITWQAWT